MSLQVIGLGFDLVGVMLLGADLIRIQFELRRSAEVRISNLQELTDKYEGLEGWAQEIGKKANWAEHADIGEGLYELIPGAFNPDAAEQSFSDAMQTVGDLASKTAGITNLVLLSVQEDKKTASSSLVFSYAGLALILTGFVLQIAANV
jgi:hypothetical protein